MEKVPIVAGFIIFGIIILLIWLGLSPFFYQLGSFINEKYNKIKQLEEMKNEEI
ncbi:hypothetical protein [Paenibacillus odorifer]|uniref:hypothetical protein n=1 Tax=Paenibacillus odorifer TaxID=189426 RepID=UPI0015C319B7|nr:hypothetical protein [Paenibacillus odorifer]